MSGFWQREGIAFSEKYRRRSEPFVFRDVPADIPFAPYVESFWSMEWDLGDEQVETEVVPTACFNIVFEERFDAPEQSYLVVVGPKRRAMSMVVSGQGLRVGVRLFPGGFLSLFGESALQWRDRAAPLSDLVGPDAATALQCALCDPLSSDAALEVLRDWLAPRIPTTLDAQSDLAMRACRLISDEAALLTVVDLSERLGCSESKLQRVFSTHVGLAPKWVLRSKRFQEAVAQVLRGVDIPWSDFALSLGYFDQAHFIRDFKQLTGKTPTDWTPSA